MKILVLTLLGIVTVVRNQMVDFKFLNPLKDKKLVDSSLFLYQTENTPQQKCVIDCAATPECGSVNHHNKTQTCILNRPTSSNVQGDLESLLKDADGWIFFEKVCLWKSYLID